MYVIMESITDSGGGNLLWSDTFFSYFSDLFHQKTWKFLNLKSWNWWNKQLGSDMWTRWEIILVKRHLLMFEILRNHRHGCFLELLSHQATVPLAFSANYGSGRTDCLSQTLHTMCTLFFHGSYLQLES